MALKFPAAMPILPGALAQNNDANVLPGLPRALVFPLAFAYTPARG